MNMHLTPPYIVWKITCRSGEEAEALEEWLASRWSRSHVGRYHSQHAQWRWPDRAAPAKTNRTATEPRKTEFDA